ncbi:hypothetical protein EDB84DRAFT_192564 [Lactarius hengduanensis]|nr:hypothetical protein EDB84DRAFT_192564 [Lactarius hengduanensis]
MYLTRDFVCCPRVWGTPLLIGHVTKSGGGALLHAQCPPNPGPYNIRYTGLGSVDGWHCILVAFLQSNFDSEYLPFSADFLASFSSFVALTFVESTRSGRSVILGFPATMGLFYQTQGAGVIFPLFWLAFILSGHTRMSPAAARIDQANAEAALFAVLIGFAVPTALLVTLQDPIVTVLWNLFPFWMWLAQRGHLFIRPSSRFHTSGYWTVQATFIFTFISSAISHVSVIWPARDNLVLLRSLYMPPISPPDPTTTSLQLATHVFMQWNYVFTMVSGLIGALWFAGNVGQAAAIALWNVIATMVVGPGAAMSGVLIWREWKLNGASGEDSKKSSNGIEFRVT